MTDTLKTVAGQTTAGALELKEIVTEGVLLFSAINVKDCVTKFKFDDVCGQYHLLNDNIMRSIDAVIDQKCALVYSYRDVGEGCNLIFVILVLVCFLQTLLVCWRQGRHLNLSCVTAHPSFAFVVALHRVVGKTNRQQLLPGYDRSLSSMHRTTMPGTIFSTIW